MNKIISIIKSRKMAKYRQIQTSFWTDPEMLEETPEKKFFYIYLFTNPKVTQCGIYEISLMEIAFQTGYNFQTVNKLIAYFEERGKIIHSKGTHEICLVNFMKHNASSSPKIIACVQKEIKNVKNRDLIGYVYGIDRASQEKEKEKEKEEETPGTDEIDRENRFEQFWTLYSKKVEKKKCAAKFRRLKQPEIELIFAHVPRYVESTPDERFRKNPLTYLNGECWNDEIIPTKVKSISNAKDNEPRFGAATHETITNVLEARRKRRAAV